MKTIYSRISKPIICTAGLILILASCVTPLDTGQGGFMLSVINTGDETLIEEIIANPILIDDFVIVAPADAAEYLAEFSLSAGPLPEEIERTVLRSELPVEKNIETDTFFSAILPDEHIFYGVNHERGMVYILLGKGEEGIKLYGFIGPVEE